MEESERNEPRGFKKAKSKAEELLKDGSKTRAMLDKALDKAKNHKGAIQGFWEVSKLYSVCCLHISREITGM